MKQDLSQQDELVARREAMRQRLRLQAERILEAVEQIEAPKTFVEVERAARAILATDKMIERVFSELKAVASLGVSYGTARLSVDRAGNAPSVTPRFACAPPPPASQGRIKDASPIAGAKGENEKAANVNIEDKTPQPVFARLTKRQKRRLRAFKAQGPSMDFGASLGP